MTEQFVPDRWAWACARCKLPLNEFFDSRTGKGFFEHPRPELDFDHEPEPVRKDSIEIKYVCDFCGRNDPTWNVAAAEISGFRAPDGRIRNYSPDWAACYPCSRLVRDRDLDGLVSRVQIEQARANNIPPSVFSDPRFAHAVEVDARYIRALYSSLFGLIEAVHPIITAPPSMDDIPPAKLPKVRNRLAKLWADPRTAAGYTDRNARILPGVDVGHEDVFATSLGTETLEAATRFCRRMEVSTQVSTMYWISSAFTRLAINAGKKLTDLSITRDEMPAAHGFLVWQAPVDHLSNDTGMFADVFGVGWTLVPGGIWIVLYVRSDQYFAGRFNSTQELREDIGWFVPVSTGGGLPFDIADETPAPGLATLFATWHLMRQQGIAEQNEELPDKATRRAYGRAGKPVPTVHVVNLRSRARAARAPSEQPGQRAAWSYRVLVGGETGGFWRTYWTGPGRTVKEQRWIEPYLTGTDGMPTKDDLDVQIVKTLR